MKKLTFMFIILLPIITACSYNTSQNTEGFIESVPYPKSTEILYEENVENGKIILYKDDTGFRIAFNSHKKGYWIHSSNAELKPKDEFVWTMDNDPSIPLAMFAGVIVNEKIEQVIVKQKTLEKEAKIIETDEGMRVWFTIFDILEEQDSGEPDPLKVEALDGNGNILWKDGIYDNGAFSGKTNY